MSFFALYRRFVIVFLMMLTATIMAEVRTVRLIDSSTGCKYVDTYVNGVAMRFLFDTGCSDVMLTPMAWNKLKKAGAVTDADLSDTRTSVIADGRQQEGYTFVIRKLMLGGYVFYNVPASVGKVVGDADCLLGQSLLNLMEYYTVRNNTFLFEPKSISFAIVNAPDATPEQIVTALEEQYRKNELDQYYLLKYAEALRQLEKYDEAAESYEQLLDSSRYAQHQTYLEAWLYAQLAHANALVEQERYSEAIEYCRQRITKLATVQSDNAKNVSNGMLYNVFISCIYLHQTGQAVIYGTQYVDNKLMASHGIKCADLERYRIDCEDEMVENVLRNLKIMYSNNRNYKRSEYYGMLLRNAGF